MIIIVTENKITSNLQQTCLIHKVVVSNNGVAGASAYQIALSNGYVGTEQEWLESLKAKNYVRKHDFVTNISFCGYAILGSQEDASVWSIAKIVIASDGSATTTTANNVKWSERLTINYN